MRTRDIPPLKATDADLDLHRAPNTHRHHESSMNRKYFLTLLSLVSSPSNCFVVVAIVSRLIKFARDSIDFCFDVLFFLSLSLSLSVPFVDSPSFISGQQHLHPAFHLNKRMILPNKRQTPAGSIARENGVCAFSSSVWSIYWHLVLMDTNERSAKFFLFFF